MALDIIKYYLKENRCYQAGVKTPKIGIQIHTIGVGQGSAESVGEYWNSSSVSACVHYCVDAETPGKVLQFLPEEMRSWADAGYGNDNLITIEICESDYIRYTDGANYIVIDEKKFKEDVLRGYRTAAELCAKICKEHDWDPLAKLPSGLYLISSHDEGRLAGLSSGHVDPTHIWKRFGLSMDGFRQDVASEMKHFPKLKKGVKVRLERPIAIRKGVSTKKKKAGYVKYTKLTASVKRKCIRLAGNRARLKKGTVVRIKDTVTGWDGTVWIQIKSGWLPVVVKGVFRVRSVDGRITKVS